MCTFCVCRKQLSHLFPFLNIGTIVYCMNSISHRKLATDKYEDITLHQVEKIFYSWNSHVKPTDYFCINIE